MVSKLQEKNRMYGAVIFQNMTPHIFTCCMAEIIKLNTYGGGGLAILL